MDTNIANRLRKHPILDVPHRDMVGFTWNGRKLRAARGEMISSALFANGIHTFGHHPRDGAPQGLYCANGQCSQCLVVADGVPVKGCMVMVQPGMNVESVEEYPELPEVPQESKFHKIPRIDVRVLIVGGGPAGLSAAVELGNNGIESLLVDDKHLLGGKLGLQTHNFFGSTRDCYAGTRGIDIGAILSSNVRNLRPVEIWLNSNAIGIFVDGNVGIMKDGEYVLVHPEIILVTCGAREKVLAFPGADIPGVYGAGAFQTIVNRDLIRPTKKLFVVGGGNVGLIGAYHAIQAGIDVIGLVEALSKCGGYKVHEDKLKRLGVPIYTSHTVIKAEGGEELERITIAQIDDSFRPIPGTERSFEVDTLLVAVGLSPVDELLIKAQEYGITAFAAGDTDEIAEASAAMFTGKISGRKVLQHLGRHIDIPEEWDETAEILKRKAGRISPFRAELHDNRVFPIIRCVEEIPCDPCTKVCPVNSIRLQEETIMSLPEFDGECVGCGRCVTICPGLAICLYVADYDLKEKKVALIFPFELSERTLNVGEEVTTVDFDGRPIGKGRIIAIRNKPSQDRCTLVMLEVPKGQGLKVAGFIPLSLEIDRTPVETTAAMPDDMIICRCERVKRSDILEYIRAGIRDMNLIKAATRAGMGTCGGRTCTELIRRIYHEEGIDLEEITPPTIRPFSSETKLGDFAGDESGD